MNNSQLIARLNGLVIFRNLLDDPVIGWLRDSLEIIADRGGESAVDLLAEFESRLFESTTDWTTYLLTSVLEDENTYVYDYVDKKREGKLANPVLQARTYDELKFLNKLGKLTIEDIAGDLLCGDGPVCKVLPAWETHEVDFESEYSTRMDNIMRTGYGVFSRYNVFTVEDGELIPIKHPDTQTLEQLPGYEKEREKIVENTVALLEGLPANNILLYGDAGTGKSSAVKAIANKFAPDGLRLVEVKKNQLYELPEVMDSLAANPLKFIIFIDDLSFTTNDSDFAALKAILEGSVCGRSSNIAVYATSNRRHLIKETMEDRQGSDIHEMDTRQELMSLSARFGLIITFSQPDKERFSKILVELARQADLKIDEDELIARAEAFAIRAGGRSPRVARQFIDLLQAGVEV
ncbi:MAG: ATP-binding protein [Coriobacteriales bacterium]|jgi:predicted AAA+ superfamily ATPase